MFLRVAILTERGALPEAYTYGCPAPIGPLPVGACVLVPFQTTLRLGYVVEILDHPDVTNTRDVLARVSDADIPESRVRLARWMAEFWLCPEAACLRMMAPPAVRGRVVRRFVRTDAPPPDDLAGRALALWKWLPEGQAASLADIEKGFGRSQASRLLSELKRRGLVREDPALEAPPGKPRTERVYSVPDAAAAAEWLRRNAARKPRQAEVLRLLIEAAQPVTAAEAGGQSGGAAAALKALVEQGVAAAGERAVHRRARELRARRESHTLTSRQQDALDDICRRIDSRQFSEALLHGVTASGKTEVYLRAIQHTLDAGRGALVLMPEIALTVHAVSQFRGRFGESLAVLHSRLTAGERGDEWRRIQAGQARLVLGPRSAVFAPVRDVGLIIIDEEHEPAFKQESEPRYHARDVARRLARSEDCVLVLGSATPAVESYARALAGKTALLEMPERIDSRPLPEVTVVDLREYARAGELTVISRPLREALADTLRAGGQSIIYLNRRAYGTFVLCRECGYVADCPHCAVSAKYHALDRTIRCHHCGWRQASPAQCPECGGVKIASFGVGTQRVQEELQACLPDARILRMDRDTTARKDSLVALIEQFRSREADVLVGTQMVAKGLDFPGVLLVGVVNADTGLHLPDFRAAERGFQLLAQVSGRAGRGEQPGRVVLQTFQPEHYSIRAAVTHDYRAFYDEEVAARQELGWPPFGAAARLLVQDASLDACQDECRRLKALLAGNSLGVEVIGPSPAPLERLKGVYRWHLLLRGGRRRDIVKLLADCGAADWRHRVSIDIDPVNLL